MTTRSYYCFFEKKLPPIEVWLKFREQVKSRFRFDAATIDFRAVKNPECYEVVVTTLATGERLEQVLEYCAGYLDALESNTCPA